MQAQPESNTVDNTYTDLATYYDNVMTSGYYDHKGYAASLREILGDRKKILDMGIGTGLFTEEMLLLEDYVITGIDFSPAMLEQAKERLNDKPVKLVCDSIENYQTDQAFEAIISVGGALSLSYREDEKQFRLYSYCCDREANLQLVGKLNQLLAKDGILCLSIQGEHADSEMPIQDGITYSQHVEFKGNLGKKTYTFSKDGKILAQQSLQAIFFEQDEFVSLFTAAGFTFAGPDQARKFGVFQKVKSAS